MRFKIQWIILLFLLSAGGCDMGKKNIPLVTISTPAGDMQAVLYDRTPKHKANFVKLAEEGYFDSTLFHRVIKEFMIQGGDPNSKGAKPNITLGEGGPGYTIDAEFVPELYHRKGALAAARQGDAQNPERASSGSQFYIVVGKTYTDDELLTMEYDMNTVYSYFQKYLQSGKDSGMLATFQEKRYNSSPTDLINYIVQQISLLEEEYDVTIEHNPLTAEQRTIYKTEGGTPHLDRTYTVFGQVIAGLAVLDKLSAVKTGPSDRPVEDIPITVSVDYVSAKSLEADYGYTSPAYNKEAE